MPQYDDHDDLAALDFSSHESSPDDDAIADSQALDFSVAEGDDEASAADAFDDFAPSDAGSTDSELDAIASVAEVSEEDESEEDGLQLFTVTNPLDTVSVSALMDGRTQRVDLSAKATSMTESELADEILVLADLARQQGLAGQHKFVLESASQVEGVAELSESGLDAGDFLRNFMEHDMHMPTPEQADAAQAEVFAARYAADNE